MWIGRYELKRPIGAGGMAEVWIAQQRGEFAGASKTVAVKLMAEHLARDAEFHRLFEAEVRLSMLLSHSNIVQVFDAGRHEGRSYLVMEWVDGLDLARIAALAQHASVRIDLEVAVHVVAEVLRGLSYAHRLHEDGRPAGIVHRDVSPHNVLLSISGEVKLTDFGVARIAIDKASNHDVRGKLRYMSPEQAAGESRSPVVDLYAVGVILHELLEGRRFRDAIEPAALREAALRGEIPELTRLVPRELEAVRQGLLRRDPAERFQTADETLAQLRRWSGFRDAREDVAALCRRFVGVDAPRNASFERTSRAHRAAPDGTATEGATATRTATSQGRSETTVAVATRGPLRVVLPVVVGAALSVGAVAIWAIRHDTRAVERSDAVEPPARSEPVEVPSPKPQARVEPTAEEDLAREEPPTAEEDLEREEPPTDPDEGIAREQSPDAERPADRGRRGTRRRATQSEPTAAAPTPDRPPVTDRPSPVEPRAASDLPRRPSESEARLALQSRDPHVKRCGDPGVDMVTTWIVFSGATGRPIEVEVRSLDALPPGFAECVRKALSGARVPSFTETTSRFRRVFAFR